MPAFGLELHEREEKSKRAPAKYIAWPPYEAGALALICIRADKYANTGRGKCGGGTGTIEGVMV